jgi:GNAT superfamily N-acetyltransferase
MTLNIRLYKDSDDYWKIRDFLRQVMLLNSRREFSWPVARWDYWYWFANPDIERMVLEECVFIWEDSDGQIVAVLNPEGHGQAFLQLSPLHRTTGLVEEMLSTAEKHLANLGENGLRSLELYVDSKDELLKEALGRQGYQRVTRPGEQEIQHRLSLAKPLLERMTVDGYTIRAMRDGLELLERCYASGLGFHDDDIQVARKNRDNPVWYHHIQSAPLYRRDLDLVAIAADGSVASFCTVWFDDVTRTAYFEPVATVAAHRRRGLGKALLIEGLHRIKEMGCLVAFVGGYSERANGLYFSVMGEEYDVSEPWEKQCVP